MKKAIVTWNDGINIRKTRMFFDNWYGVPISCSAHGIMEHQIISVEIELETEDKT